MKRLIGILAVSLILAIIAGALASCNNNGSAQVDEGQFKEGVRIDNEDVTLKLEYEYDGDKMTAEIRYVQGVTYYTSADDGYWYVGAGDQYIDMLHQLSESYELFSYSDGFYTAERLVYTEDDYEYEIVNVSIKFDSNGRLAEFYYEEEETDGNRYYSFTLVDYASTEIPAEDDIVRDNSGEIEGPAIGGGMEENTGGGNLDSGNNDTGDSDDQKTDITDAVTEEEWISAFDLGDDNLTALVNMSSPNGTNEYEYRVVDGVAYYCDPHNVSWMSGSVDNFTQNVAPFVDRYSDFEFDGRTYYCAVSSLDYGEGVSVTDIYVRFDEYQRLIHLSYTLNIGDESGYAVIDIYGYGETLAPDTVDGGDEISKDNGAYGNMSQSGNG